jgi:PAS domain S-box-containing protein
MKKSDEKQRKSSSTDSANSKKPSKMTAMCAKNKLSGDPLKQLTEGELAQSGALLRSFFDSPGLLSGVVEIEGDDIRYITVNTAMAAMYGMTPGAVSNKLASEIGTDSGIVKLFINNYKKSRENNAPAHFEYYRQVGLETHWFSVTVTFLGVDPASRHPCYAFITSDVTERKKAQEALQESEQKLRWMFESIKDGVFVVGLDGKVLDANAGVEKITGYSRDQLLGQSGLDYVFPGFKGDAIGMLQKIIARGGMPKEVIVPMRTANGDIIEVEATSSALRDGSGNPVGLIGTLRDVSERRRMEAALRDSEDKLRVMYESMAEAATITDIEGRIIDANPASIKLHGFENKKEMIGLKAVDLVAEQDRERAIQDNINTLKTGKMRLMEYKLTTKSGIVVDGEFCTAVMRNNSGKPRGFIGISRDISERKHLEDALRENERKLRTVFGTITDGLIITDMTGVVSDANEAAVRIGKHKKGEVIGRNALDFIPESERKRLVEIVIATIKDTERLRSDFFEYTAIFKDGSIFNGESSVAVMRDISGQPTHIVFVTRDISERKRLQDELKQSERKLRTVFSTIRDGLVITDMTGIIVDANESAIRIGRYESREEFIGRNGSDFIAEAERKRVAEALLAAIFNSQQRGSAVIEYIAQDKDSKPFYGESSASMLQDNSGRPTGMVFVTRDISERKRLEESLRESEQRFRELADLLPQTIFEIDVKGRFTYLNRYGFESLGCTQEDIEKGINVAQVFAADEGEKINGNSERVWTGGPSDERSQDREYAVARRDGSTYPAMIYTNAIIRNGQSVGWRGVVLDITERKKVEQMKTDFVSFISHQLRTPIAGLTGYIDNMLNGIAGKLNDKQIGYLKGMREVCNRNSRLIADLLNISRLERGVISVNIQQMKLRDIVDIAVQEYRSGIQEKGLALNVNETEQDVSILADSDKLVEVLKNVIHNALKFTKEGSISVEIMAEGNRGIVRVKDTGKGMSEEVMKGLFKKEKILSGKVSEGGGAGLGLFIAKGFMQLQQGDITVESTIGEGSTFVISLPRA